MNYSNSKCRHFYLIGIKVVFNSVLCFSILNQCEFYWWNKCVISAFWNKQFKFFSVIMLLFSSKMHTFADQLLKVNVEIETVKFDMNLRNFILEVHSKLATNSRWNHFMWFLYAWFKELSYIYMEKTLLASCGHMQLMLNDRRAFISLKIL